jgi:nucleoside-diphosphate-sugar epimerase
MALHQSHMPKIVVTGSDGFVGKAMTEMLASEGHVVVPLEKKRLLLGERHISCPEIENAMRDSQAVIHLAARAHITSERHVDPLSEFRRVNVDGALSVAEMAARAGVARFVFVSSIGVLGNTSGARIFTEDDTPSPAEAYAVSKWEAEQALRALYANSPLQLVIVRPPLAYGPRVKGNFLRLLRLVAGPMPLPFGAIENCRSYVGIGNLCALLAACALHPSAAGHTFHVADEESVSTPELVRMISGAMGKRSRMFRCPPSCLRAAAAILGRRAEFDRLAANLRVDSGLARRTLGWRPSVTLHTGVAEMVRWFERSCRSNLAPGRSDYDEA